MSQVKRGKFPKEQEASDRDLSLGQTKTKIELCPGGLLHISATDRISSAAKLRLGITQWSPVCPSYIVLSQHILYGDGCRPFCSRQQTQATTYSLFVFSPQNAPENKLRPKDMYDPLVLAGSCVQLCPDFWLFSSQMSH